MKTYAGLLIVSFGAIVFARFEFIRSIRPSSKHCLSTHVCLRVSECVPSCDVWSPYVVGSTLFHQSDHLRRARRPFYSLRTATADDDDENCLRVYGALVRPSRFRPFRPVHPSTPRQREYCRRTGCNLLLLCSPPTRRRRLAFSPPPSVATQV